MCVVWCSEPLQYDSWSSTCVPCCTDQVIVFLPVLTNKLVLSQDGHSRFFALLRRMKAYR